MANKKSENDKIKALEKSEKLNIKIAVGAGALMIANLVVTCFWIGSKAARNAPDGGADATTKLLLAGCALCIVTLAAVGRTARLGDEIAREKWARNKKSQLPTKEEIPWRRLIRKQEPQIRKIVHRVTRNQNTR